METWVDSNAGPGMEVFCGNFTTEEERRGKDQKTISLVDWGMKVLKSVGISEQIQAGETRKAQAKETTISITSHGKKAKRGI